MNVLIFPLEIIASAVFFGVVCFIIFDKSWRNSPANPPVYIISSKEERVQTRLNETRIALMNALTFTTASDKETVLKNVWEATVQFNMLSLIEDTEEFRILVTRLFRLYDEIESKSATDNP